MPWNVEVPHGLCLAEHDLCSRCQWSQVSGVITFEPISIAIMASRDSKGMLVSRDGSLIAVIVLLEDDGHDDAYAGKWHFEATFDGLPSPVRQVFSDLDEVQRWIEAHGDGTAS